MRRNVTWQIMCLHRCMNCLEQNSRAYLKWRLRITWDLWLNSESTQWSSWYKGWLQEMRLCKLQKKERVLLCGELSCIYFDVMAETVRARARFFEVRNQLRRAGEKHGIIQQPLWSWPLRERLGALLINLLQRHTSTPWLNQSSNLLFHVSKTNWK